MGAASASSRPRPASSHEMPDDHNVPMDDPIIKEPASAPPQPSAVTLGKRPAVDKPTSAPRANAAGLPLTLARTTAAATSGSSGARTCSVSTQLDATSLSAIAALHRRFPPMGVWEVVAAQHAATRVAQMGHPIPRANPTNPWQGIITAKQLTTIHNTDLPRWQVLMETADAHWAHTPRTGNLWSRFVKMVEQEGKEVNPHLNKGPGIRRSMDGRYYIPDLNVWTWLHDNCPHAHVKGWQKGDAAAFYEIAMNLFRTKFKFNKFVNKHQLGHAGVPHWSMTTRFHKAVSLNVDGVRVWSPIGVAKEFIASGLDESKIDVLVGYFGRRRRKAELGRAYRDNILDKNGMCALGLVD
ncbi:hypothetical protein DACRYDRAFT_112486 [Dacryopinax primogenitus]|uniref:Uncharacterized protein n=1 Tax=Dacryopinax primogenitus (strain DJM 731) TaxID=1858805 RepID=M5FQ25_DACPD|nr:uncharacterized protein DACRYDRAFT_112486 [Dacryopinax primogenitus]EJT96679.1 hypothetical protein DACRYDRAFT_112486 [Dacryopinax primogenitus]